MRIAYVRVSTEEQNEARQRSVETNRIEKWFCEKRSAKDTNRPQLEAMLSLPEAEIPFIFMIFHGWQRNTQSLLQLVQRMQQKEIQLISCQRTIDTATATGKLMLTMIAAINEFERSILLERQKEGIAIAKKRNRYKGRKRIQQSEDFELLYGKSGPKSYKICKLQRQLEISRPTVDRLIGGKVDGNRSVEWQEINHERINEFIRH